jgi:Glycosyl hydrolase 109, C-terminal domain
LIHCAAGYQHDCRQYCFNEKGNFSKDEFAPSEGASYYQTWSTPYALNYNGNLYPTHAVGPIAQYLNIDRGDRFSYLVSMSSKARGLNLWVKEKFGPNHPNAKRSFAQGDISTTLIKTQGECTIALYFDSNLPRPYDLAFRVQGTKGLYMMTRDSIYVEGEGKADTWQAFGEYRQRYEHPLWKKLGAAAEGQGHGGADYVTLYKFIQAVRNRTAPEVDVYDTASWSAIMPLSIASVSQGSAPVEFPDFTKGKWKSRPPLSVVSN